MITLTPKQPDFDVLDFIMAYEDGRLDEQATVAGFQHLINTGLAWQLQGHYGRTAAHLIAAGFCTASDATHTGVHTNA